MPTIALQNGVSAIMADAKRNPGGPQDAAPGEGLWALSEDYGVAASILGPALFVATAGVMLVVDQIVLAAAGCSGGGSGGGGGGGGDGGRGDGGSDDGDGKTKKRQDARAQRVVSEMDNVLADDSSSNNSNAADDDDGDGEDDALALAERQRACELFRSISNNKNNNNNNNNNNNGGGGSNDDGGGDTDGGGAGSGSGSGSRSAEAGLGLVVSRLTKRYTATGLSGRPATKDLSLVVSPGELVVLLGPNGAGKSTLMNIVTGDIPITTPDPRLCSGQVAVAGVDLRGRNGTQVVFRDSLLG